NGLPFFPSIGYSEQIIKESDMDPKVVQINHTRAAQNGAYSASAGNERRPQPGLILSFFAHPLKGAETDGTTEQRTAPRGAFLPTRHDHDH
ncbi:MAG TPA: hypothetical protein VFK47_11035, partial [Ktedonobacteraceae bacterium]|nr:hypothetical protein [Ktedonobacteraceae bacterium]